MRHITILALATITGIACAQSVALNVNVNQNRRAINPNIYGVAYASRAQLSDLNATLNRQGGNPTSRYNWQQNVDNRGSDWFFQSIPYASSAPGAYVDTFVQNTRDGGAQALVTMPMIDWVAKAGPGRSKLTSFSVAKYGAQQYSDPGWANSGNGIRANGQLVTGNDPNDASTPNSTGLQAGWVDHLTQRFGNSLQGGVKYFCLDNEPSIWFESHRDVAPTGLTMRQARDKMVAYSTAIKDRDPNALALGPEEWGWGGFIYSGFDQQAGAANGYTSFPDRAANGNMDYAPWLLKEMRLASTRAGRRLLDIFTLHYYPQGGEFSDDVSNNMQLLRNRSTRSLWDPNYTDTSWINDKVKLIPRMKQWVASNYPNTPIGLTEYNWGAENHINGATAQADCLGIFGREGLDMATRWTTPPANSFAYNAFKMYRNYDGRKSTFGNTSVLATTPNPDNVAIFAAVRSTDNALTIMTINKQRTINANATINLTGVTGNRVVEVYQLKSNNRITKLANLQTNANKIVTALPAQSITLFVVK